MLEFVIEMSTMNEVPLECCAQAMPVCRVTVRSMGSVTVVVFAGRMGRTCWL
jgi:hypothetical protein